MEEPKTKTLSKVSETETDEDEDSLTISGKETREFVERLKDLPKGNELVSIEDKINGVVIELASKKFDLFEISNLALQIHSNILNTRLNFIPKYIR